MKEEIEEQPEKMPMSESTTPILKEQSRALSLIGQEYASSVTSESDAEDRISSSWIKKSPLAKILEYSKEGEGLERDIRKSNEQTPDLNDAAKREKEETAKRAEEKKENDRG